MRTLVTSPPAPRGTDRQPRLGAWDRLVTGLDDVAQCMRTILLTPKGAVPHQPSFGSDVWTWVDSPIGAARPHLMRETLDAITRWEPRAQVTRVLVGGDHVTGRVSITVEWRPRGSAATAAASSTTVELAR